MTVGCVVPQRTGLRGDGAASEVGRHVSLAWIAVGALFAAIGAASERLASVWPAIEAQGRPPSWRTIGLATVSGLAAAAVVARSQLPWWATAVYLGLLALLVVAPMLLACAVAVRRDGGPALRRRMFVGQGGREFTLLTFRTTTVGSDVPTRVGRLLHRYCLDELPQLLDLLAAASHAGLGGPLALRRAVDGLRGPLADELGLVLTAVDLGGRCLDPPRCDLRRRFGGPVLPVVQFPPEVVGECSFRAGGLELRPQVREFGQIRLPQQPAPLPVHSPPDESRIGHAELDRSEALPEVLVGETDLLQLGQQVRGELPGRVDLDLGGAK